MFYVSYLIHFLADKLLFGLLMIQLLIIQLNGHELIHADTYGAIYWTDVLMPIL